MTASQEASPEWPGSTGIDAVLNGIDALLTWQRSQPDLSAAPSG